jgi:hypothetical protein
MRLQKVVHASTFLALTLLILTLGCATESKVNEPMPVAVARKEAYRQGWKKIEIDYYELRDGFWEVHIYKPPRTLSGRDAWIKISPEGKVMDFSVNTR